MSNIKARQAMPQSNLLPFSCKCIEPLGIVRAFLSFLNKIITASMTEFASLKPNLNMEVDSTAHFPIRTLLFTMKFRPIKTWSDIFICGAPLVVACNISSCIASPHLSQERRCVTMRERIKGSIVWGRAF